MQFIKRLGSFWLGARLFIGNYQQSGAREPRPQHVTVAKSAHLELYEPNGKIRKTVLLITGVSIWGEEEPRLIRLARSMNATGLRVAVPVLYGLKSLRFERSDLDTVRECLRHVLETFGNSVDIVAFSAGGSIALTLSCEPEFANRIKLIALFSPIYNPHATWKIVDDVARTPITDWSNPDDTMWLHTVNAYRNAETLGFIGAEKESIKAHLQKFTSDLTLQEKIAFHQNVIAKRPMNGHEPLHEVDALNAITSIGNLANSPARIVVLHDSHDFVVPVPHIHALADELNGRAQPNNRILITPALSHVTLQPRYMFDILTMIDMIGELYT